MVLLLLLLLSPVLVCTTAVAMLSAAATRMTAFHPERAFSFIPSCKGFG
jgi:hypothetical protein